VRVVAICPLADPAQILAADAERRGIDLRTAVG